LRQATLRGGVSPATGVARGASSSRARHAAISDRASSLGRAGSLRYCEPSLLRVSSWSLISSRRSVTWSPQVCQAFSTAFTSRSV
jgi:hypothetical protein